MNKEYKKFVANSQEGEVKEDKKEETSKEGKDKCYACGKSSKEKNIGCECIFCGHCLSK